jgi:alkanesulfonate monooxygenase SsuD/methylene tetrahydromethanopterin reductase-like flavin-dependent oxidoreductase (luciferase family)
LDLLAPLRSRATPAADVRAVQWAVGDGLVDAVWVRDLPVVPLGDADAGQLDDPFAYLARIAPGANAIRTLGTASVILGIRHPLVVARAAAGAQMASEGRFVLGVGSGGKPAMNDALGVGDRSADRFAGRWRDLRAAVAGQVGTTVELAVPAAWTPPPMYLASARTSHWAAIDGDADGCMAFLEPWPDLDRTSDAITRVRNGIPPPVTLRIDLTLGEDAPRLEERGRLHCRVSDLAAVFTRRGEYPVEHVMLRVVDDDPERARRTVRAVWDDTT